MTGVFLFFMLFTTLTSANEYYVYYQTWEDWRGYCMVRARGWVVGGGPPGVEADSVTV
jgi:hypothetical protein